MESINETKQSDTADRSNASGRTELTDDQRQLHQSCQKGCTADVVRLLCDVKDVDCPDEHGMSPLQQAAYRGHLDVCRLLLDRGADVNSHRHEHGYTALMFAALCANTSVVSQLLDAGASTTTVNGVGRNAAQMAAFVGNHECVSVINNYVALSDVEYFAEARGDAESEPRLARCLVRPLHRLASTTNVHPVAIVLFLQDQRQRQQNGALLDAADRVINVLRLMSRREENEVLALKFHLLAHVVEACDGLAKELHAEKQRQKQNEEMGAGDSDDTIKVVVLDGVIRRWLRGRKDDGFPESLERLVRAAILNFPFPQFPIVQQLVRTLTSVTAGDDETPSALSLVTATVCGQRFRLEDEDAQCATCGSLSKGNKKCSACKLTYYCSMHCQKLHWFVHKRRCLRKDGTASSMS